MQHFSVTDWADFVREVAPAEQRGEMQQHLDSACPECSKTAEIWSTVMDFAQRENLNDPPASALTSVASSCTGLMQQAVGAPEGIEIAKLAFDSFQRGLAGERGTVTQMPASSSSSAARFVSMCASSPNRVQTTWSWSAR